MVDESDGATADIRSSVNHAAATPHQKLVQAMPKWSFKSQMSLLVHTKRAKFPFVNDLKSYQYGISNIAALCASALV